MRLLLDAYEALGTLWWIEIDNDFDDVHSVMLKEMIISYIQDFEQTYSRFQENSLLSQLNEKKYIENVPDEFIDMLQRSLRYEHLTNGIFSIAVGSVLEHFGYGLLPSAQHIADSVLPRGDAYLDISHRTVRLSENVRIDLGGIGKAYLIERIAALCDEHNVRSYIINGGGDVYVQSSEEEIVIEIEHPANTQASIASIALKQGALCTSSPFKRRWVGRDHVARTHLVHPEQVHLSADQFQDSATVYAPMIVDADIFATVCAILGSAKWNDIQHLAPLFHAEVMLCSARGELCATQFFESFINT